MVVFMMIVLDGKLRVILVVECQLPREGLLIGLHGDKG